VLILKLKLNIFYILFLALNVVHAGNLKTYLPFKNIQYEELYKSQLRSPIIAIIDTGVDLSSVARKDSVVSAKLSQSGKLELNHNATSNSFGLDFTTKELTFKPIDNHGHGTHIAGIINEINPSAKLLPIKYYNPMSSDEQNLISTISAIKAAIELNVDIINYSSGGEGYSDEEYLALKEARDKGIVVITAAGNFGKNIDTDSGAYYPASYNLNNIISVININKEGTIHPTSNWGRKNADLATYGTDVTSFLPLNKLGTLSGTSQATAIISAYASLFAGMDQQKPHFTKLKNIILKSVEKTISLRDKCKTGGFFSPAKFKKLINRKYRRIATK
tara:strand:+ start:2156 stop:3154 length:999 start_codon:yes stop_codon:yes gene_type:complete